MTIALKSGLAAALAFGALTLDAPAASAMPLGVAPAIPGAQIDAVRWVCGPYRCYWVPNHRRHWRHRHWRHW